MTVCIVAEMSGNHHGSLQTALDLLYAAKEAGADAVKLQTLHPDRIAAPGIVCPGGPWAGRDLRELYQETMLPWDWHGRIFDEGRELGIEVFSSPFDPEAVAFLDALGCPRFKVASPEVTDYPLLTAIAATRKRALISDGMASENDLRRAMDILGYNFTSVLRCVSEYPAFPGTYDVKPPPLAWTWGVSDHTLTPTVAVVAVTRGASVIEKHFTLSRADGGPDALFSLEPEDLSQTVRLIRETEEIMGASGSHGSSHRWLRKSLWVVADVKEGDEVTSENVRALRPCTGADPFDWPHLVGRRFAHAVAAGTPLDSDAVG